MTIDDRHPREPQPPGDPSGEGIPVWLSQFPHTSAGEDAVTRRAFTRYLIAGSGVFAASALGAAAWTSLRDLDTGTPTPVIDLDDLPEGSTHLFRYPGPHDPAIMMHLPGGALVAYSQKCTHLGCVVFYEPETTELVCPAMKASSSRQLVTPSPDRRSAHSPRSSSRCATAQSGRSGSSDEPHRQP